MSLDVNTPEGQKSVKQEQKMLDHIKKCWGLTPIHTPLIGSSISDGFLINKKNEIVAVFESKCRNMSLAKLEEYGSWLITEEKIRKCRDLSELLNVPFLGFLRLNRDNLNLFWKITDNDGKFLIKFDVANTETQETCNGGLIYRDNAYLPIEYSEIITKKLK